MKPSSLPYSIFALIVISTLLLGAAVPQAVAASPSAQADGVRYGYSDATGKLTFVGADPSQPVDVAGVSGVSALSAEGQALGIIDQYADAFGLSNPSQELRLEKAESFENRSMLRYQQVYGGIPVMGGELILNTQGEGYLLSLSGEVSPDLALDTAVQVSMEQASEIALQAMQKWYPDEQASFTTSEPELWIYDPRLLEDRDGPVVLGWRMEVTSEGMGLLIRELVLVDAKTGNVPLHFNQIDTGWNDKLQDPAPTDTPTETPLPTDTLEPTATPVSTETPVPTDTPIPTEIPTAAPAEPDDVGALVATPRYVATTGTDSGDCTNSATPCLTINYAIGQALDGDTIYVAAGTYTGAGTEVVLLNKSITPSGGWDESFLTQNGTSTIDGQAARGGARVTYGNTVTIERFRVTNGRRGIWNDGTLILSRSAVIGNAADNNGGGIYNGGSLTIANSTISGNSGDYGGGIANQGSLTINNSTITGNRATSGGGGIVVGDYKVMTLSNSIVANNSARFAPDCDGTIISSHHNIIGNTAGCTVTAGAGDQFNIDPQMSAYAVGAGYYTLQLGSSAIDAGDLASCPSTDQRGMTRPQGATCDIGAYEYAAPGAAASFGVANGSNQQEAPTLPFSQPLAVYVLDSAGSAASGVSVTFQAPASGPSGTFVESGTGSSTVLTDSAGIAKANLVANGQLGSYAVTATVAGLGGSVTFSLTNAAWYVSPTGSDANSCTVPANPCATINGAITKAGDGGTVMVAAGTYVGSGSRVVYLDKSLTIVGGWNPTFLAQDGRSIIDGNQLRQGIYFYGIGRTARFERFLVRNGTGGYGGNIFNFQGTLVLRDFSVSGGAGSLGGGVHNNGTMTVENSTISQNSADSGGGIYSNGPLTLINVTISQNSADSGGGIWTSATATLDNSLLGDNTATAGPDCSGTFSSGGYNLISDIAGCSIAASAGDKFDADPELATFLPVPGYHPLSFGSPAIDAGNPATCLAADQRGVSRPQGAACDIGAYEYKTPGAAASIGVADGSGQRASEGISFTKPLMAYVLDSIGSPVSGITVTFTAPASGAGGTFADSSSRITTAITNDGVVASAMLRANLEPGSYDVSATASGVQGEARFSLTNLPSWFIAPDGNDSNSCGSVATPCRTIDVAIGKAVAGDAILVATGTYTGSGSNPVVTISKSITLSGGWNSTFTAQAGFSTIDGQHARTGIRSTIGSTIATLERLAIQNGGGSEDGGGGIFNDDGTLTINNSTISGSSGDNGGGILNNGTLTLNNTSVSGNTAGYYGGGIYNTASLTLKSSTVSKNQAGYSGAGIFSSAYATLDNSTISGNTASAYGGGVYGHQSNVSANNVTLSGNTARSGGGLASYYGTVMLNQLTITANVATDADSLALGGGLYVQGGSINIQNSLVTGNAGEAGVDCYGTVASGGHNLIGWVDGCGFSPAAGDLVGRSAAPVHALLGDLRDNGGPTLTHALLSGSVAIDAGDPATCASTDQRGVVRPQGAACDIGAFEGSESQSVSGEVKTYTANHAQVLPGTFRCDQSMPNCTGGSDPHADAAQKYAIGTYSLYLSKHARVGIDGNNMPVISTVHFANNYANAYWSGAHMVYGDGYGFPLADDVVAHELTHGVTQYESNLFYFYESGAINESLSDVWGEYYDQTDGQGNDAANVKWLMGEDITGLGAIRSMSNPPAYGDPDKMTSSLYNKKPYWDNNWDNGGVHSNSGVNNKAAFLMVQGGTFNNKTVSALGWDKTAAIYYEVQTHLLASGAGYADLYNALYQACLNLADAGVNGITTANCQEVRNATSAVEMNREPSSGYNPDAAFCPSGQSTGASLTLFQEGFENGTANWSTGGAGQWVLADGYASSPTLMMWGDDTNTSSDSRLDKTTGVALPAGTSYYLHFKHAYAFEYYNTTYWDGGRLEYTINNGGTWLDAKPLFSAGANYKGTISSTNSTNALKGKQAFVGDSHGYVSSRYSLQTLAGQTVRFRWRFATDQSFHYLGWFLDDVRIYRCVSIPSKPTLQSPADGALVTDYTPLLNWSNSTPDLHHYHLQVATNSTFTSLVYNQTSLAASQYTIPANLAAARTYYWRVSAYNALNQTKGWSSKFSFRTALPPPALLTPANGAAVLSRRPTFDWTDVAGATGYTIQISTSSSFSSVLVTGNPTASTFRPGNNLPAARTLYWRVRSKGTYGPSAWSAVRSFRTP